jgi:sporulation protein YlmC with PRC-barrel domain
MEVVVTKLSLKRISAWYSCRNRGAVARTIVAATMIGVAMLPVFNSQAVRAQPVELVKVDLSVVGKGYRATDLIGKDVVNAKDEEIGTIEDIIIDQQRNLYAVLEVGSFLGLGGHLVVVPYETFKIDATGDKVELAEASKEELQKLEEFKYEEK